MSNRAEKRAKMREKMQRDSKDTGKGGKSSILDFSDYDEVSFYKTVEGKNEIDILPFEVTTKNEPSGCDIGDENYKLDYYRHTNIGPNEAMVLCLKETFGRACPICEARKELLDSGVEWDAAEPKALKAKRRCTYNVIDLNNTDKGVQLYDASWHHFEKKLFEKAEYKDPAFICFADPEEGYSIEFRGAKSDFSAKYLQPQDFDFLTRQPYSDEELQDVYPLDAMLVIPTYVEVEAIFLGTEDEEKTEETKKEAPARGSRKSKADPKPRTEAKPARETPKRESRKKPTVGAEDRKFCPFEHIFGNDWGTTDECMDKCEEDCYNACEKQYNDFQNIGKEPDPEPEPEPEKPKRTPRKAPEKEETEKPTRTPRRGAEKEETKTTRRPRRG